jgi:hypothetical protein
MAKQKTMVKKSTGKNKLKKFDDGKSFEESTTDVIKTGVKAVVVVGALSALGGVFRK